MVSLIPSLKFSKTIQPTGNRKIVHLVHILQVDDYHLGLPLRHPHLNHDQIAPLNPKAAGTGFDRMDER